MEIKIEIPNPPKGWGEPFRAPIYTSDLHGTKLILIGCCWCKPEDRFKMGGGIYIQCKRKTTNKNEEVTA